MFYLAHKFENPNKWLETQYILTFFHMYSRKINTYSEMDFMNIRMAQVWFGILTISFYLHKTQYKKLT